MGVTLNNVSYDFYETLGKFPKNVLLNLTLPTKHRK